MITCCTVLDMLCMTGVILIFYFELFFALSTPLTTKKIKTLQRWKVHLEISSFYMSTKIKDHMMYGFWNMVCNRWTDRRTDGQSKNDIHAIRACTMNTDLIFIFKKFHKNSIIVWTFPVTLSINDHLLLIHWQMQFPLFLYMKTNHV